VAIVATSPLNPVQESQFTAMTAFEKAIQILQIENHLVLIGTQDQRDMSMALKIETLPLI
tara:strand:- start:2827 stop:3006 length:180 start_codon:yes stop_codon:yes gene_type:complete